MDDYYAIVEDGKQYLSNLQKREAEKYDIPSLKIGYNNVFGYYLEVPNSHKNKVPDAWIRKQTLTGVERYMTEELKIYEEKILVAEEKIIEIELSIFDNMLALLNIYIERLQVNAQTLAIIDCLAGFATLALTHNYVRPILHEGMTLDVKQARHPVIEQMLLNSSQTYIPNDICIGTEQEQIMILTGPNMSGKSALLRQTALITLMTHIGSFVPCQKALIPLTDKIFTRVGASDNLTLGESTFMVEMNETASIINNMSARSLILLDEIGRGTSTYDGIAIASSVIEFLHQHADQPKTFFATHYHELSRLEQMLSRVKNYHIAYQKMENKVIFLRHLKEGASLHSFGIHVAKMSGLPQVIIDRAYQILKLLESHNTAEGAMSNDQNPFVIPGAIPVDSPTKFLQQEWIADVKKTLNALELDTLTPIEALLELSRLKNKFG